MSQRELAASPQVELRPLAVKMRHLHAVARAILRYGLVALLVLFGAMKFTAMEAQGIVPLVEHQPLLSWMYGVFGIRGTSDVIGVVELTAAALMSARAVSPRLSAIGSAIASGIFVITVSFLFTTPGVLSPDSPFGGFLMKDIILLGAALFTTAEAADAAAGSSVVRR